MPRGRRRRKSMTVYLKSGAVLTIPVWSVEPNDDSAITWTPVRGELTELVYLNEDSIEAVVVDHSPERTASDAGEAGDADD